MCPVQFPISPMRAVVRVASFQTVAELFGEMLRNMSSAVVNGLLSLKIATLYVLADNPACALRIRTILVNSGG